MSRTLEPLRILIHACPQRMWYVQEFLVPYLEAQGILPDEIEVWNDSDHRGNLESCMESFRERSGDGGTWHLQDDILPCRDFAERIREYRNGVVFGFCCSLFGDGPDDTGQVYAQSAWNSFQCVHIPDPWARECARWYFAGEWRKQATDEMIILQQIGKGDDTFFHNWLITQHGREMVVNAAPNLVEHVDWMIGGSVLHRFRDYIPRADHWTDSDLVAELKTKLGSIPHGHSAR